MGWVTLTTLAALSATAPVGTDLYLPAFPEISLDLSSPASAVQLTLTSFLLGMATGQLIFGPMSDRWGRRIPILMGAAAYVLAGVVAALSSSIEVLIAARAVQGLAGAAGLVIGRAIIADLASGPAASRAFSLLMAVVSIAPIIAPFAGSLLLGPLGWRGLLWCVVATGLVALALATACMPETHPPERRTCAASDVNHPDRTAIRSRAFVGFGLSFGLSFATLMAYIAASPFIYRSVVGLNETTYGATFALNALGLTGTSVVAARWSRVWAPQRILTFGLSAALTASVAFFALATTGAHPGWYVPAIFAAVASLGLVFGTATSLALEPVSRGAGTASAILGFGQFAFGALASPLVGIGGDHTAVPAAAVMTVALTGAVMSLRWARS